MGNNNLLTICGDPFITFVDGCPSELSVYAIGEDATYTPKVECLVLCESRLCESFATGNVINHIPDVKCGLLCEAIVCEATVAKGEEEPPQKRTTLYEDGTLIINELPEDRVENISIHGNIVGDYDPWIDDDSYDVQVSVGPTYLDGKYVSVVDGVSAQPWDVHSITSVKFGSYINPTYINGWFAYSTIQYIDWTNCDLSQCASMAGVFAMCHDLQSVVFPPMPNINYISHAFDRSGVTYVKMCGTENAPIDTCTSMFIGCRSLETIKTDADFSTALHSANMFYLCESIEGSNGTTYDSDHVDKDYAVIDEIGTPGYFTNCLENFQ